MDKKLKKKIKPPQITIGWIEHIDLPELDLHDIRVKIDTGARTSALHATKIEPFQRGGADWVRFNVQVSDDSPETTLETPLYETRHIKNTSGIPEERYVIRTQFCVAGQCWPASVSLTDRSSMRFPMIVGRSTLKKHNVAVHTKRAHLTKPKV